MYVCKYVCIYELYVCLHVCMCEGLLTLAGIGAHWCVCTHFVCSTGCRRAVWGPGEASGCPTGSAPARAYCPQTSSHEEPAQERQGTVNAQY